MNASPDDRPFGPVESPCTGVCKLDGNDVCTGCYRTAQEISDWGRVEDDVRRQILAQVAIRTATC